jgi:hypothetical protein
VHPVSAEGDKCAHDGDADIAGVPAHVKFHQPVTATAYVCRHNAGLTLTPQWWRADSAVWYLSTSDSLGFLVSQGSAKFTFSMPMPGNNISGSYRLVARVVPDTYSNRVIDATTTFDLAPPTDPADIYPGAPQVQKLVAGIDDDFASTGNVALPDTTCVRHDRPNAPTVVCTARNTASDSADRYKDVVLISVPALRAAKLQAQAPSVSRWLLSDGRHGVLIDGTRDANDTYDVTPTFAKAASL